MAQPQPTGRTTDIIGECAPEINTDKKGWRTMDKTTQEILAIFDRLPPDDQQLFYDLIEAVSRATGKEAQLIRKFMEVTQGLPFSFEREIMRTVIAAVDGNQEAWRTIKSEIRRKSA